jgi:hypothetical protein
MRITMAASLLFGLALPLAAQEMQQLLLPVAPSVAICMLNSRYETRLVVYNGNDDEVRALCADDGCGSVVGAGSGRELMGSESALPTATFLFVPAAKAGKLRLSLLVESSDLDHPEDRSFGELPIVNANEFRETKLTFVGVRLDEGFRQGLRIFGLDGTKIGQVEVRVYDLATNDLMYDEPMTLWPLSDERNADGQSLRPSYSMECNLSADIPHTGRQVRIEIEPLTEGLKIWSFVSVTNNRSQHFYTIVPR